MARTCPHCRNKAQFTSVIDLFESASHNIKDIQGYHYIEKCAECGDIVYSIWDKPKCMLKGLVVASRKQDKPSEEVFSYPVVSTEPPFEISDIFTQSFKEGVNCLSIGAPFAALIMFRRCLQIIVDDKGGEGDNLKQQINLISPKMSTTFDAVAHIIRELGNDAAHPNEYQPTIEDTKSVYDFLLIIVEELYILPQKIEALNKKKEE